MCKNSAAGLHSGQHGRCAVRRASLSQRNRIVERRKYELQELLSSIKEEEEEYKFYLEKLRRSQEENWLHSSSSIALIIHWLKLLHLREILRLPYLIYQELIHIGFEDIDVINSHVHHLGFRELWGWRVIHKVLIVVVLD